LGVSSELRWFWSHGLGVMRWWLEASIFWLKSGIGWAEFFTTIPHHHPNQPVLVNPNLYLTCLHLCYKRNEIVRAILTRCIH
jgi:hypothetical protein